MCRFCKIGGLIDGEGLYVGYMKCSNCNMYQPDKVENRMNVITPEDPMDALLCEGCQ